MLDVQPARTNRPPDPLLQTLHLPLMQIKALEEHSLHVRQADSEATLHAQPTAIPTHP